MKLGQGAQILEICGLSSALKFSEVTWLFLTLEGVYLLMDELDFLKAENWTRPERYNLTEHQSHLG